MPEGAASPHSEVAIPPMAHDENDHPTVNHAARIMKATVARARRVTPHMAEVTIAGPDLHQFPDIGPDQFVYLFIPRDGWADPRVEHDFDWDTWRARPEAERQLGRYYTVRRLRPAAGEVDLHIVLHGDGPLTTWAARAQPGDPVALWGPRAAFRDPGDGGAMVLAADEAGLPALAAILERLPATARGLAAIEVAGREEFQELAAPPAFSIRWLERGARPYGEALWEAVTGDALPAGVTYAWAAGESRFIATLRRHFGQALGLPGERVCAIGYWHRER